MMDLPELLHSMSIQGLGLRPVGCNAIEVTGPVAMLTGEQKEALAYHKSMLLQLVGDGYAEAERAAIRDEGEFEDTDFDPSRWDGPEAQRRLCDHSDPRNWQEEGRTRPGWLRATCRKCGRFVGYRPLKEHNAKRGRQGSQPQPPSCNTLSIAKGEAIGHSMADARPQHEGS